MATEARVKYLEKKVASIKDVDVEKKYRKRFEKYARYMGNGVYEWQGMKARDTRVLFLKGVLFNEKIKFTQADD